jgi:phosphatidylserine decarboxylase
MLTSIAREGYPIIAAALAAALLLLGGAYLAGGRPALLLGILGCCALLFAVFSLYFFRDPERHANHGPQAVISPADGTIIDIREVDEARYMAARATRISIFMSVFNVHVNRAPVSATVEFMHYNPGKFLSAFKEKASLDNEQLLVGLRREGCGTKMTVSFIAGLIARRIVFYKKLQDRVSRGERINMIRFGSRVDLYLPAGTRIAAAVGDRVKAGETLLAELTNR